MTDEPRQGPAFTIVARGRTALLDSWVLVRRRGGRLVRVTIPLVSAESANIDAAIQAALASVRDYPSRDAY